MSEALTIFDSEPDATALSLPSEPPSEPASWKILVVDDEEDVHAITRLALRSFTLENRPLQFLHAYSAKEAEALLIQHPDIAVVLLDVVMENNRAGFDLVEFIRTRMNNETVRIVLRTGQPGLAPESRIFENYQIDDYRLKTELTQNRLHSVLLASIRTYDTMLRGEAYRESLERAISERTAEIQRQKEALEALNELKNKLFSILSHDLRSPLSTLESLIEGAERQMFTHQQLIEFLGEIRTHLGNTLPMLNQLVAWAQSQLEGFRVQPEAFELEAWLNESIALQQIAAGRKELQLYLAHAPFEHVWADREMASLVLRNLIQNAIKFTPIGGEICIQASSDETHVKIEIIDSGIGIPVSEQDRLKGVDFASRPGTEGEPGTGLGLILCREFSQLNGGSFWFYSQPEDGAKGATFGFSLPLNKS